MKPIEKLLCNTMHNFVKEHIDELTDTAENLGFMTCKDMLSQINNEWDVAAWALTELCNWGFKYGNGNPFLHEQYEDENGYKIEIFKLQDGNKERFCRIDGFVVEVSKVTKMIEVTRWEKTN